MRAAKDAVRLTQLSLISQYQYPDRLLSDCRTAMALSKVCGLGRNVGFVVTRRNPASVNGQTPQLSLPPEANQLAAAWCRSCRRSASAIKTLRSSKFLWVILFFLEPPHHLGCDGPFRRRKHGETVWRKHDERFRGRRLLRF